MDEFGLQFLKPRLGLLMFGQIADEAGEVGLLRRIAFRRSKDASETWFRPCADRLRFGRCR